MRKLFFVILILLYSGLRAQDEEIANTKDRLFSASIGIRPFRGELRAGVDYRISNNISLGPEFGYKIKYGDLNVYSVQDGLSRYSFEYLFNNMHVQDKFFFVGFKFNYNLASTRSVSSLQITPFYSCGWTKNARLRSESFSYVESETTTYSGGEITYENFGIETLYGTNILKTPSFRVEFVFGGSLFYKKVLLTYDSVVHYGYYPNSSYNYEYSELQSRHAINKGSIMLQTGLYIIL